MEVQREQAEPVIQDHVAPREEVLGDEAPPARVRREDGRAGRRGPVVTGVRAPRLAVEEPPEPETACRLAALDRGSERARTGIPARWRRGPPSAPPLGVDPGERRRVEVDHALRQRELLGRNVRAFTVTAPAASAPPFLAALGRVTRQPIAARPDVEVDPDQRGYAVRRQGTGRGVAIPLSRARPAGAPVTWRRTTSPGCGLGGAIGTRAPRRTSLRQGNGRGPRSPAATPPIRKVRRSHSGVGPGGCWRRRRSISATRSVSVRQLTGRGRIALPRSPDPSSPGGARSPPPSGSAEEPR